MKIVFSKNMGKNPASVNLDTGVIEVNARLFSTYDEWTKRAIIAHEIGHYVEQNQYNEELADKFAINFLAGKSEKSLRRTVSALLNSLESCNIPEHRKRQIIISALEIDAHKFGNKNARRILEEIKMSEKKANASGSSAVAAGGLSLASSIIAAAMQQISLVQEYLLSPKALWFVEGNNQNFGVKNPTREQIVRKSVQGTVLELVQNAAVRGEDYIMGRITDRRNMYSEVFAYMSLNSFVRDRNIQTKDVKDSDAFYKAASWTMAVINDELETQKLNVHNMFNKSSSLNWLKPVAVVLMGILVLFLIKKYV